MEVPAIVQYFLDMYDAYLVGSSAEMYYISGDAISCKDFDIIIPPKHWNNAMLVIMQYPLVRYTFAGGLKIEVEGNIIDVWSMDLGEFYMTLPKNYKGYVMNKNYDFIKRI